MTDFWPQNQSKIAKNWQFPKKHFWIRVYKIPKSNRNTKDKRDVKHYQLSKDFSESSKDENSSTDEYSAMHSKKAKEGPIQGLTPKKKRNRMKLKNNDYYRSVFDWAS